MNESTLEYLQKQAILVKELVAEKLQLDYNQQLSYPEIFKLAYQSNSELFDASLPFEDLGVDKYFNAADRKIVDNIGVGKVFHVYDVYNWLQVCDYQMKVWNMHGNMLVNDQTYYSVDIHNVNISTYHYSGVTLVEIEAVNNKLAGMELLLKVSGKICWVLKFVAEDYNRTVPQYAHALGLISPDIAERIEEKSRQWRKVIALSVEAYENVALPSDYQNLGIAEMLQYIPLSRIHRLRTILSENSVLLLNNLEMMAIDDVPYIRDLHSSIAETLREMRRHYHSVSEFVEDYGNDVWWLDTKYNVVVRFHEGFWAEVYVKHSKVQFDYPILMKSGSMVVRFVPQWPATAWMNKFLEIYEKAEEKEDCCLYKYKIEYL